MKTYIKQILVLILVVMGIYIFSPNLNFFNLDNNSSNSNNIIHIDIRNNTLANPKEGDIKIKVGSSHILDVTTDTDGRLDLISNNQDTFNPIFANVVNTLSVPTSTSGSLRIEFRPGSDPNTQGLPVLIGVIVVR